jgi:hypothetical protein
MVVIAVCAVCLAAWRAYHRWVARRLDQINPILEDRLWRGGSDFDFLLPIPRCIVLCAQLDHFLMRFWFVLFPLVILFSFGIALSIPSRHPDSRAPLAPSEKP